MIDHILLYANDAASNAAWPSPEDEPSSWSEGDRSMLRARVIISRATYDAEGVETMPEVTAPGSWLVVRTPYREAELEAMPECMIATDSALRKAGLPYVIKCSLQPETMLGQVDPVWAGAEYGIPVGQPASVLDEWRIEA